MKRTSILTCFVLFAAAALLLGITGCNKEDNPVIIDVKAAEAELVGMWWDEFKYSDVTEDGTPFSRAMFVVEVNEDHTGSLYLAVFDDTSDEPLAIYGGPKDSYFAWQLLNDGTVVLSDPDTGESIELARKLTRGDGKSYGNSMTDKGSTTFTFTNGSLTAKNGSYSATLKKADAGKTADITKKFLTNVQSNVGLESGGKTPENFNSGDIR